MDTSDSINLTPAQLEVGLINDTIDQSALNKLLTNNIHENENIDALVQFFQHYIPGNRTMNEFIERIRHYNSAQICGLVWNANVIAYRCKTCSISPCMSICAQCFQNGNHEGHNFNMFKSQAGGACDCGDATQSLIGESLAETSEIPSRLVHISVQLFSSNIIAEYAMKECHLIEVILSCIWHMFVPSVDHDKPDDDDDDENILKTHPLALTNDANTGMVVDVEHRLIVKNVYWPLLSDFVNILSQEKIAFAILENKRYLILWLRFLTLFQGMNVNERVLTQHVEYEPQAYMYAFTIELEISAAAMWCFVGHLKPN
ncbi:unnamed protein product, partial [Rotaria magnacalcarata]